MEILSARIRAISAEVKMKVLILCMSLLALPAQARFFYLVGDSYVARYQENAEPEFLTGIAAKSYSFDVAHCRLWLTEFDSKLKFLDRESRAFQVADVNPTEIISDLKNGVFLTRSLDRTSVQLRDEDGHLKMQKVVNWVQHTQQVEMVGNRMWAPGILMGP